MQFNSLKQKLRLLEGQSITMVFLGIKGSFESKDTNMLEYYKSGFSDGLAGQWEIISDKYFQGHLINMVI